MQDPIDDLVSQARDLEAFIQDFRRGLDQDVGRFTTQVERDMNGWQDRVNQSLANVTRLLPRLGPFGGSGNPGHNNPRSY